MPICSYLVHVRPLQMEAVIAHFSTMPGCTATASDDGRALVLVTDTPDLDAEDALQRQLKTVPGVEGMALAFGYTEPEHLDAMTRRRGKGGATQPATEHEHSHRATGLPELGK